MIKNIIDKNEQTAPNAGEMEVLHRYFPQCFTKEGTFDIDLFKSQIQDKVNITHEGYDLNFLGKNYAKLLSSMDTTTVIVPDEEHNALPENANSQNIYISGDNLDGLKHLLKSYAGAVKCIYIDPPYNTGTDGFVYNDRFTFTAEELSAKLSISEEQAAKILDLTRRGSASHSAWLTFMACRLQLARDLLTDDGVIFISIDDNEQANLKLLCDSVFGEENFLANFSRITKKAGKTTELVANNNDYVLCYKKSDLTVFYQEEHSDAGYKHSDEFEDERGKYKLSQTLDYGSIQYSASLDYEIIIDGKSFIPGGVSKEEMAERQQRNPSSDFCWRWSKELFDFGLENGFIVVKGNRIYTKTYQNATISKNSGNYFVEISGRTKAISSIEFINNIYSNDNSRKNMAKLFKEKVFEYSKPVKLIDKLIRISTKDTDIILDFFSGSATTAQAVMQLNAEDGGNRRFIMVQLPEETLENSTARKAGYKTIDQIGQERIRRAAAKIKVETGADIDYGFKHYTLAEPDSNTLDQLENFDPNAMFADETVLEKFGKSTVLETWLVRDGYGFGASANEVKLDGYTAYHYDKHLYLIDIEFTEKDLAALIDRYNSDAAFCPENIVIFGYSFTFTQTEMLRKNTVVLRDGDKNLKINIDVRY